MDAARRFYTAVLGPDLWGPEISVSQLPAQALARGAKPHWLGHLGVDDVGATAERLFAQGAERLGPMTPSSAVLRDPFGALLGLGERGAAPSRDIVRWHTLHTRDMEKAFATYASLFGWSATERVDVGPAEGRHQGFTWKGGGRSVGSISDAALQPHIHTQWLYFFHVPDLLERCEKVRSFGGLALALPPIRTATGDLLAGCDDDQGGAFGLFQPA